MIDFLVNNWAEVALALISLLSTLSALTDSEKDDKWVDVLSRVINAIVFGRTKARRKNK